MVSGRKSQGETMHASHPVIRKRAIAVALGSLALVVSACSGMDDERAGLSCLDDSPDCVGQRQATLKSMIADQDRKWVRESTTPQAHASGVRLFAFRSRKKEMSCEELAIGGR